VRPADAHELPAWRRPLPRRGRALAGLAATALLLAACGGEPPPGLAPIAADAPDAPVITSLSPAAGRPAGGEEVVLEGERLHGVNRVWIGEALVYEVTVADDGKSLRFRTPVTRAGAVLDVGVGRTDDWGEVIEQRVVRRAAFSTSGLPRWAVGVIGAAIGLLALLGTPLFVVIAAVTCLGWYLEAQLKADVGFFTRPGEGAGLATDVFISWLKPMGDSPLFIAIPLFTFAGALMGESKTPTRLINLARALLGWLPGGLALVTIVTCSFFTAFTGASGVTIIALGGLLFPILLREKYPERFTLGLLTTCGSLGLLFPPSLPVIVYGLVARVDVGRLFQAALLPGIVLCGILFLVAFVQALRNGVPRHPFDGRALGKALLGAAWELPLPVIVIGGIYGGFVTAAEASAVTAFYVLLITIVVHRDIPLRALPSIVRKSAVLVGAILMIIGTALGFTSWLTTEQVPQQILALMQSRIDDQLTFLLMLNVFLLIVGCLMDIFSATLVVVPLIVPVALEFGVDPYHLAVIFLVNLEIGYSTPPVGINLFIAALRFRRSVLALYAASVLFILVLLVALALVTYVPKLSLGVFDSLPTIELSTQAVSATEGGDAAPVKAVTRLGGVDLEQARQRHADAVAALTSREQVTGLQWSQLAQAAREAESRLTRAPTADERRAASQALKDAREAQEPLRAEAERVDEARKLVQELETLARTVKWRSRRTGQEEQGETFDASRLEPGEHRVTATARDDRGHVAQAVFTVHVEPRPADEGGGDDGGWGWDDGGADTTTEGQ
jgi:tripartite ATP-independent transporter DctM subunit